MERERKNMSGRPIEEVMTRNNYCMEKEMQKREMSLLKKLRFERRLTQCSLMLKTGIPQCRLSLIESGYYPPKPDEAQKIAKALEMKVSDIFPTTKGARK